MEEENKKLLFVHIFDISPCVFTQILNGRARWMRNLIPHPKRSPDQNLSKNTGRYVENTNKKVVFYDKYVNSTIMVDSFYWNSIGS